MRKTVRACVVLISCGFPAALQGISEPRLVADLATVPSPQDGSAPAEFVEVGAYVLFTAAPGDHAGRLLRTDGTPERTQELANACGPLEEGGFALRFATAGQAFYCGACSGRGEALWVSDATAEGTRIVLGAGDYRSPGPSLDVPQWVEEGEEVLFLQGGNYSSRLELWRSDGTSAGTASLGVLSVGESVTAALHRRGPNDYLVLVEERFASVAIWKSDGTAAGTSRVLEVEFEGQFSNLRSWAPIANGITFIVGLHDPSRAELWYSDGTAAGTQVGVVLPAGMTDKAAAHDGSIYFTAGVDGEEWVWRGDGSAATTRPIVPLGSRRASSDSFEFFDGRLYFVACAADQLSCALLSTVLDGGLPEHVAEVCDGDYCVGSDDSLWVRGLGSRLIFTHRDETAVEVLTSAPDGGGASSVATLCAADACFGSVAPVVLESAVFFATVTDVGGSRELWTSDGTPAGTVRLAGPLPAIQWYLYPSVWEPLAALPGGGGWVFAAADTAHGLELWRARPQADSGAMVEDLRVDRPGLLSPEPVGAVGSNFVFALSSADGNERRLYRHATDDGPVEAFLTVPVRHRHHGVNSPPSLRVAGNAWYFIENDFADEDPFAEQIWRYDPVTRDLRTLFAEDPQVTGIGARADDLVPSGADFLFLGSIDPELHPAIYRLRPRSGAISKLFDLPATKATSIGRSGRYWFLLEDAQRVVAIDLESRTRAVIGDFPGAYIDQAVALDEGVLFAVIWGYFGGSDTVELRQADGIATGSLRVGEWSPSGGGCGWHVAFPPKGSASPALFAVQTYCTAGQSELWTSDGSVARTRSVRSFPQNHLDFAPVANRLRGMFLFLASHYDDGTVNPSFTIWRSDGTAAGTQEVAALPGDGYPSAPDFTDGARGGEAFYFVWSDADHGRELWRTDGTATGTGLAADIEPGPATSSPGQLRTLGDQVIFRADTTATGLELWQVDGGSLPAQLVADLYPGIESSAPLMLGTTGAALYFLADDGVVGREIWGVDRPSVAPCAADATTLCLADGRFRARATRRDFAGEMGEAGVVPLTGDSGYFWFFDEGNPEVMLKIVDACGLPGFENFWAYSTGLTNVEVELEVVDTVTGERKNVRTALGVPFGPDFDSGSFQVCDGAAKISPAGPTKSLPGNGESHVLPLLDGRFEATVSWAARDGRSGAGQAVAISGDSGYFWFFAPSIVEVLVKMVDACGYPGFDNFWVFAGGLTDVEVQLVLRDTWSGITVSHHNSQGAPFTPLLETGALRVCDPAP